MTTSSAPASSIRRLPAEATDPALCGAFTAMQMAGVPNGAADTGGGSTAANSGGYGTEIGVGAAALLAVGGAAVIAHRRRQARCRTDA